MRRILVLRGGALGDGIVALPALRELRSKWPAARIDLVGNAAVGGLAVSHGIINQTESPHTAPWHQLYASALDIGFREHLANYDCVISFWADPDGDIARVFPVRPRQIYLSADALPRTRPAARHFNALIQSITGSVAPDWIQLVPPRPVANLIAIHPGSGSPRKNWPLNRWEKIADWLRTTMCMNPVFILGEAEAALVPAAHFEVWRNLPLAELARRLATCRLFLGHDSGISHLAGAYCHAGLLLFGPTDPGIWAPPNPQFKVLGVDGELSAINVEQVRSRISAVLADQT
ncbi:MAG: glycosyltransferase family 9 protein [Opitutaceae bacterium]|nr:glycosyltransferase family 9 protein [Opitutaceae bacterium]